MGKTGWQILKWVRRAISFGLLLLLILSFSDPDNWPNFLKTVPSLQFGQLIAGFISHGSTTILILLGLWTLLTILFGRWFCALICPLGASMDLINIAAKKIRRRKFKYKPNTSRRYLIPALALILFCIGITLPFGFLEPYSLVISKSLFYNGPNFILLIVLLTATFKGRTFCNFCCPTGLILRLLSRYSIFKIKFHHGCVKCGACARICQASCINVADQKLDNDRCLVCLECLEICPANALVYSRLQADPSSYRRKFFKSAGAAALIGGAFLTPDTIRSKTLPVSTIIPILPPGALSLAHLNAHCSLCHTCIRICPNKALVPSLSGGIALWDKPILDAYKGFCQYNCTLCTTACPTGALTPLTIEEKHLIRLGLAQLDLINCVVFKNKTSCGACAEICPTGAVHMVPADNGPDQPEFTSKYCIGCGACQGACPVRPVSAIHVNGLSFQETAVPPLTDDSDDIELTNDFPF